MAETKAPPKYQTESDRFLANAVIYFKSGLAFLDKARADTQFPRLKQLRKVTSMCINEIEEVLSGRKVS